MVLLGVPRSTARPLCAREKNGGTLTGRFFARDPGGSRGVPSRYLPSGVMSNRKHPYLDRWPLAHEASGPVRRAPARRAAPQWMSTVAGLAFSPVIVIAFSEEGVGDDDDDVSGFWSLDSGFWSLPGDGTVTG